MVTFNETKIDISTIPEFIVDTTIKDLIKDSNVFYADGYLYKDGEKDESDKKIFVSPKSDIDALTTYLFGEDFVPLNYSNEDTVEYILEQYEFNLSEIIARCPYPRYTFSYKDRQLVLCIYFSNKAIVSRGCCMQNWRTIAVILFCIFCYVVIWTVTNT